MNLLDRLREFGQEHLLAFEERLQPYERERLRAAIERLDLSWIRDLAVQAGQQTLPLDSSMIAAPEAIPLPAMSAEREARKRAAQVGEDAIRAGRVAVLLVAGGQGTRLGFAHPKGMFPIGPVRNTSLFQIFAETILAWRHRTGAAIPWYILTSPDNHSETIEYFTRHGWFGLPESDVRFFQQGTFPAIDAQTGRLLLAGTGELFTSPNGHGGTLLALRDEGILDDMKQRGINLVSYFQVDNPLAQLLDPAFLGFHIERAAEASVKVVRKVDPEEKVGVVVRQGERTEIIEYSDLPQTLAELRDEDGRLVIWAGSIAIHVFSRDFLERMAEGRTRLPIHFARKVVPTIDAEGNPVVPESPNAIKFEMFIFDLLPLARRVNVVETARESEFAPVKNATGADSPASVRQALVEYHARCLEDVGVTVPRDAAGLSVHPIEISPLWGLDRREFESRIQTESLTLTGPTYLGPESRMEESLMQRNGTSLWE